MSKPIKRAKEILEIAKREINDLLGSPEHIQSLTAINTQFRNIETRLTYMAGVIEPELHSTSKNDLFPPIKKFMGKEIVRTEPVKPADINPSDEAKKLYLGKLDKLYAEIVEMKPDDVLKNYTLPEDVLVLRGVAKRAGVEEFDKKGLTIAFIEEIQTGVALKLEEKKNQEIINADLRSKEQPDKKVLTQKDIQSNKKLVELQAKPGDTALYYKDGTITLEEIKAP